MSDFYFSLQKNVAYGARNAIEPTAPPKKLQLEKKEKQTEVHILEKHEESCNGDTFNDHLLQNSNLPSCSEKTIEEHPHLEERLPFSNKTTPSNIEGTSPPTLHDKTPVQEQPKHEQSEQPPKSDHHKRNEDAVAAAKERFLARKRAKEV